MNRTNKNKCDVHFFTDFNEYEYIRRVIFDLDMSMADANRERWFGEGWRQDLESRRKQHRKKRLKDQRFWHPKQIKQEEA